MNTIWPNHALHSSLLLAFALFLARFSLGGEAQFVHLGINTARAETIVVATLAPLPRPPQEKTLRQYYTISVKGRIKGACPPNSLLVVHPGAFSTFGRPPTITPNCEYILFLDHSDGKSALPAFSILDLWCGLVALDANAVEQRSEAQIQSRYDVDVREKRGDFLAALKRMSGGKVPTTVSPNAEEMFQRIK